jgi:hypothetical protein
VDALFIEVSLERGGVLMGHLLLQPESRLVGHGRRYQLGEGGHNIGNMILFWNHHPHNPKEESCRCYASPTAYATMTRLCNVL